MTSLAQAVGYEYNSQPIVWNKRDLLLYAVGIGAKKDDLQFVYELDNGFSAFPTYPVVLPFKLAHTDVSNFGKLAGDQGRGVPGLPKFDRGRGVHGSQYIEITKPLPLVSSPGWNIKRKIVGVHENKTGIVIDTEILVSDANGEPYARMFSSSFNIGAKVTGKHFNKTIASAPVAKPIPKDRKPIAVFAQETSPEQAIIYRLSGDYNPLHIDPAIGMRAGFGGPILHGLATFGFVARGILANIGGNNPDALKAFGARFSSPVKLGDKLETSVWEVGSGPNGTTEVTFMTKNVSSGKVCLAAGIAFVKTSEKSKL